MSVYSQKGRGWKYDFTLAGQRHTSKYYKTKGEAKQAEARRREEVTNPQPAELVVQQETPTDMAFLELVNRRLDFLNVAKSAEYYRNTKCLAKGWVKQWGRLECGQISRDMVETFMLKRGRVSKQNANKELRYLKALFNWGLKKDYILQNPTRGIEMLPVEKRLKYVPSVEDVEKVLLAAGEEPFAYLLTIRDTMARVGEVNRLTWEDVDLERRFVVLYTRKKRGGHLTPRKVPMTGRLHRTLQARFEQRRKDVPWVFYGQRGRAGQGDKPRPCKHRYSMLHNLCRKAGVKPFGFHALRHAGASLLDGLNVPIGTIQRILGHENRTTTEIYLHSIGAPEVDAMAAFERASGLSEKNPHPNPHPNDLEAVRPEAATIH